MTMIMPAGTYYIGDLCYVLDSRWEEFCALTIEDRMVKDGVFTMSDGTTFATFSTAYGDGFYQDNFGNEYPVDAGLIGCVAISSIDPGVNFSGLGHQYTFYKDFEVRSHATGVIDFGQLSIDTDPNEEVYGEDRWMEDDEA